MTQSFTILGRLPGLNDIISAAQSQNHGAKYAEMKIVWTQFVFISIRMHRLKSFPGPVEVTIHHIEPDRKRDPDNITGGANKFVFDGMVAAKLIRNDTQKYVKGINSVIEEPDWNNPRIFVKISEYRKGGKS